MDEKMVTKLLGSQMAEQMQVSSQKNGFLVRLPFRDYLGDPIEVFVSSVDSDVVVIDDLGHTAGLLFELGQHTEDAPGHLLLKKLVRSHGLVIDYDSGILSHRLVDPAQDSNKVLDFIQVLISVQTVVPELPSRRRELHRESRLRTRLGHEIRLLRRREYVDRETLVEGKHEAWLIDYQYVSRGLGDPTDVLIVTADLKLREPRQKAEHVITLAMDVLAAEERPHLRVVYDVSDDGNGEASQRAADMIEYGRKNIGFKAYNYADLWQRDELKRLTLQELSPALSQ